MRALSGSTAGALKPALCIADVWMGDKRVRGSAPMRSPGGQAVTYARRCPPRDIPLPGTVRPPGLHASVAELASRTAAVRHVLARDPAAGSPTDGFISVG